MEESVLFLVDVGPEMHKALPDVDNFVSMLVEKKLIYNKSDEVGIILFGAADTKNELTNEVGGYEHVVVLHDLRVVDDRLMESLPPGTGPADFLDALVVGMDILIKKYGETNKGKKRLCLITSAQCPIKLPYQGTKEDQAGMIASQMSVHGMLMDCVLTRGRLVDATVPSGEAIMAENDRILDIFREKARAKIVSVGSSTSLLGALKTRRVAPVTVFRGNLEITPRMNVKVWVYKKTSEERLPALKMYSDRAPANLRFATHEVKIDYEYTSAEEGSRKVVPPEQRIKGYRYGPQVIPISSAEWDAAKFKPEKGVKLLGFTDASNIARHSFMKDACVFIPEPGDFRAGLAVSALARAMKETGKLAIVRCVWRQGQGNVVIGVLNPRIADDVCTPDAFYFNVLPFAEDVREFHFPSLQKFPSPPTEEQQRASDDFVRRLDLAPPAGDEALRPEFTPNPILARFYRQLELKSRNPDAGLPPLDEALRKIVEPDPDLFAENASAIDLLRRNFKVQEKVKMRKSTKPRHHAQDGDPPPWNDHYTLGKSNPVEEFESVMSTRGESGVEEDQEQKIAH